MSIRLHFKSRYDALRPVLVGVFCGLVLLIAAALIIVHARPFDSSVRAAVHSCSTPALTNTVRALTWLGSSWILIPLAMLASALLRRWFPLFAIMLAEVLTESVKLTVRRHRPEPWFHLPTPGTWSFPSGHSLNSMVFYPVLAALLLPLIRSRVLRVMVIAVAALLPLLLGFTRMYLGVHWPSDVLSGWIAGACVAAGCIRGVRR